MAKLAIITDTHFGVRNDSKDHARHFKRFYDEVFFPYLRREKVDGVLHTGDIVDKRKNITFTTAKDLDDTLVRPIHEMGLPSWWIVGNHDAPFRNTLASNSMEVLYGDRKYDSMTIVSEPKHHDVLGKPMLLVPWICDENRNQALEYAGRSYADVCAGHFEFAGFQMYKGSVVDHGDEIGPFEKFKVLLSGHYHHRNGPYLGTPYEITWSDHDDPKGFHVLDTETLKLEFVQNPIRMHRQIDYDDSEGEGVYDRDFSEYNDTLVKVVVRNRTNPNWFERFVENLEQANPISVVIRDDSLQLMVDDAEELSEEVKDTWTLISEQVRTTVKPELQRSVESMMRELYQAAA